MNKRNILVFIVIFLIVFIYSFFISSLYCDEIWNYGFSYNVSLGMIPYRDFNMVVTPLYSFIGALFIFIFGYHLYSLHIFNSLMLTILFIQLYNRLGMKSFIIIPFILLNCYLGYNILCVFLLFLVIWVIESKVSNKDIIIGFLISLLFLTKHVVGMFMFIPMIYYSRNKIKSLIVFLIPIMLLFIYLLYNQAFYQFIDYCFLGLIDFGDANSVLLFFPIELFICVSIVYYIYKSKMMNRVLFYILMFQIITIPIFDDYHFMIGFIPCLFYFLDVSSIEVYKLKYFIFISVFICFLWGFYVHPFNNIHLYSNKNSYLYGRNVPVYIEDIIEDTGKYIIRYRDDYDYIFLFSSNSYYIKLNIGYIISKYDLINNGNMGYNGSNKYIREINEYCVSHKCMFILYKYEFKDNTISQTNEKIINFVKNNYYFDTEINDFEIYKN